MFKSIWFFFFFIFTAYLCLFIQINILPIKHGIYFNLILYIFSINSSTVEQFAVSYWNTKGKHSQKRKTTVSLLGEPNLES